MSTLKATHMKWNCRQSNKCYNFTHILWYLLLISWIGPGVALVTKYVYCEHKGNAVLAIHYIRGDIPYTIKYSRGKVSWFILKAQYVRKAFVVIKKYSPVKIV